MRKRNFPIHALQKVLNYKQFKVTNRKLIDPRANSPLGKMVEKNMIEKNENKSLTIRINFKALKIRNTKDLKFLDIQCEPNLSVNNLIRKAITLLYKRFDKKLKIERDNE